MASGCGQNIRREVFRALTEMGFTIEASHHELVRGQHEIDFVYDDALKNPDKRLPKNLIKS